MQTLYAYMAGPDVFLQNAHEKAHEMRALCRPYGVEPLIPADNDGPGHALHTRSKRARSLRIFQANVTLIERAHVIIANLEPFRRPSADVGTVWEIGYAFAKGKRTFAYATTTSHYLTRVSPRQNLRENDWIDQQGMLIENFGLFDNLMIHHSVDGLYADLPSLLASKEVQDCLRQIR